MPIPPSKNVGKTMRFLKNETPGMPQKQKVAVALSVARKAGVKIPKKKMMTTSDGYMRAK